MRLPLSSFHLFLTSLLDAFRSPFDFNICGADATLLDLGDACVRRSWAAILPAGVLVCLALLLPLRGQFPRYLSLREAEALGLDIDAADGDRLPKNSIWRTVVFAAVGVVQCLCWSALGGYALLTGLEGVHWQALLVAGTWLYAVVRSIALPIATPPYDLLALYSAHLCGGVLQLGGHLFNGSSVLVPTVALSLNLAAVVGALGVIFCMPMEQPSERTADASPEDSARLWAWVTFSWIYPLIKRGRNTTLHESDVWSLSPTNSSRALFLKFQLLPYTSLFRRIWAANSADILMDFSLAICSVLLTYATPFFLKRILDAVDKPEEERNARAAYVCAGLMFACQLLKAECDLQHLWVGLRAAARIRSELMAAIYDKALKRVDLSGVVVSASGEKGKVAERKTGADIGTIVNLMSGDAHKVGMQTSNLYIICGTPLELFLGSLFLYQLLGWSAFTGFLVLLLGWPLNSILTKQSVNIQQSVLKARDARMGVLTELIGAIKFVKLAAWETRWIDRVLGARAEEIRWMVRSRLNRIGFFCLWITTPILISVTSFCTYVLLGNELTISKAFTAIALFGMIRTPLNAIPSFYVQILQLGVSVKRISDYLEEPEVSEQVSTLRSGNASRPQEDDTRLGLERASLRWNEIDSDVVEPPASASDSDSDADTIVADDHKFELRDVSVVFPEGRLTVVTGPTASGKTALLMALLGEMTTLSGRILMSKNPSKVDEWGNMQTISYAAQSPWLRHQSIKDNILFGYPYDEARYNAVIECCALRRDLDMLEDGDDTEIGEKGVSLSGGQKARVALARAVYARTKFVLLDDPLSAVVRTSLLPERVFLKTFRLFRTATLRAFCTKSAFCGPLLANRTVVLVTHHVELVLPGAYYLVRMLDGRIDTQGTVKDLQAGAQGGVLVDIAHDAAVEVTKEEATVAHVDDEASSDVLDAEAKTPRKLIAEEHRETGAVKWGIYKRYLHASSYYTWAVLLLTVLLLQLLGAGEKLWIKIWGDAYRMQHHASSTYDIYHLQSSVGAARHEIPMHALHLSLHETKPQPIAALHQIDWSKAAAHPLFYVGVYASILCASAIVSVVSSAVQITGALRASRVLFKSLLTTVVRATFRFHDTTPQGRILNRFGKDIDTIDSSLSWTLQQVNSSLIGFIAAATTVTIVFPAFLIPALFIGYFYYNITVGYLNTGRDLRRMEANSRSPIFSDFSEVLQGIVTVRAFAAEKWFLDNMYKKIDLTTKIWYMFWMTNRWLCFNFDILGSVAVFVTAMFSIYFLVNNAGLAGLAITSALNFTTSVYCACRYWTGLELDLNAVERVVEYLDLPQEPPAIIASHRPPAYWPSTSANDALLVAENLSVKYADGLPAVIQDVSFSLKAGERVGILGRTGSGKSTLAMSILRFNDPSSGRILIDGIDITTIGVEDLRSRLTFLPQDATLFSGTLRQNLDPFDEHDDAACLDVLQRVQIITRSGTTPASQTPSPESSRPSSRAGIKREGSVFSAASTDVDAPQAALSLDTQVSPGGANFSQGQRQLIAMARALLRRSAIVIFDEATSSIDFETDAKIQTTIREEFTGSLLLTVAHRINTVIDYDRLLVLDKGKVVECDTPWALIQKEDGVFRELCMQTGYFGELEAVARAKAERDAGERV
ncbi:hypothetical protein MKEN_00233000 [Mycena kentingensis (nom. inval.)]|nr:hypothetical protein MKEN_00233000 [Mycena kentingensis (nom. inval.)]